MQSQIIQNLTSFTLSTLLDTLISQARFFFFFVLSPSISSPFQVSAAVRVTDGALLVIDVIEGVSVQTKTGIF